jgi:large conductance mechanosensitive channel
MIREFREFIMRGNVIDLAVGIIIGAAFGAIVNSLVNDIIMPPIGYALGNVDFTDLFIALDGNDYESLEVAREAGAATINYGLFINTIINFAIVGFAMFMLVRTVNRLNRMGKRKEEAQAEAPATPDPQQKLIETLDRLTAAIEKRQV